MEAGLVTHEFDSFFDKDSRVLILGTIPSPKSREQGFYYGHPQNRFWKVLADVMDEEFPETVEHPQCRAQRYEPHFKGCGYSSDLCDGSQGGGAV